MIALPGHRPHQRIVLLALLAAGACAGPEWRQPPSSAMWQGRSLWASGDAVVGARHEGDAVDGVLLWEQLRRACTRTGLEVPPAPLLLLFGVDDELCRSSPEATCAQLEQWHRAFTWGALNGTPGAEPPPVRELSVPPPMSDESSQAMMTLVAGLGTAAIQLPDESLQLPPTWQRLANWAMLLPSDERLVRDGDRLIDIGMTSMKLSLLQRILMAPLMPLARSKARNNLRAAVRRRATEACVVASFAGRSVPPGCLQRMLTEMDVPDPFADLPEDEPTTAEQMTVEPSPDVHIRAPLPRGR